MDRPAARPGPEAEGRAQAGRGWLLLGLALGGGSVAVAGLGIAGIGGVAPGLAGLDSRLAWSPQAAGEAWRWWTAAWVHLSALHLAANLAGLAGVLLLGRSARLPGAAAWAWALAWPLSHLLLLPLAPALSAYAGLSGVLHAGVVCAGVWLLVEATRPEVGPSPSPLPATGAAARARSRRRNGGAVLGVLAVKLMLERPWGADAARAVEGWDIPLAPVAHAAGALAGLVTASGLLAVRALLRRSRTASVRAE